MYRRDALKMATVICGSAVVPTAAATSGIISSHDSELTNEFTDSSQRAIEKGTKWLLRAINKDGGAGLDIATPSDVACTSLVGMALLSQGHTPSEGIYNKHQRKLANFLLTRCEKSGSGHNLQASRSQIEGDLGPLATHFFCTLFLSQAIGEAPNVQRYLNAIQTVQKVISRGQHNDGSWGKDAWAPLLGTACGWVSLRAANFAGIKVDGSATRAAKYLLAHMPRLGASWGSGSWYHRFYGTAAGLRVLYAMQKDREPKARDALKDVLNLVEKNNRAFGGAGGEEYLTFHLLTEMLIQKGGRDWKRWYPTVRDKLVKVQNRDGSWTGHHCITSRTFSTACALLTLTAPNRYLPISQV